MLELSVCPLDNLLILTSLISKVFQFERDMSGISGQSTGYHKERLIVLRKNVNEVNCLIKMTRLYSRKHANSSFFLFNFSFFDFFVKKSKKEK